MTHEVIIPGRTVIPPEGLITVELRNANNGRLKKKVTAQNDIMDWFKGSVPQSRAQGLGRFDAGSPDEYNRDSLNPLATAYDIGVVGDVGSGIGVFDQWNSGRHLVDGNTLGAMSWVYGTPVSDGVDPAAELDIPTGDALGECTGGFKLHAAFTPDGVQAKRGTINLTESYRTWNQVRVVGDFSSGAGNGTWRSIGFGSVLSQEIAPGGMRACRSTVGSMLPPQSAQTSQVLRKGVGNQYTARVKCSPNGNWLWYIDRSFNDISRWDLDTDTLAFSIPVASLPGGSSTDFSICETATDFWVINKGVLYRTVAPTTGDPLAAVNTYDLSGTVGTDDVEMAWDGTSLWLMNRTTVYEVNPATGALTGTSWAHGLSPATASLYLSIEWDGTQELLWLNYQSGGSSTYAGWGPNVSGSYGWRDDPDSSVCRGFTRAGSQVKAFMGAHSTAYTDEQVPWFQLNAMPPNGAYHILTGAWDSTVPSPAGACASMASRAVLPSDIDKTSDDTLSITYDWNFT